MLVIDGSGDRQVWAFILTLRARQKQPSTLPYLFVLVLKEPRQHVVAAREVHVADHLHRGLPVVAVRRRGLREESHLYRVDRQRKNDWKKLVLRQDAFESEQPVQRPLCVVPGDTG